MSGPESETFAPADSEAALLAALRAGDAGAFEKLVARHHATMVRVARTYVPSDAIAEEVAQEAWLGVVKGLDSFEGRASVKTWLFRILVNRAMTRGQRESRTTPFSSLGPDSPGEGAPAHRLARSLRRRRLVERASAALRLTPCKGRAARASRPPARRDGLAARAPARGRRPARRRGVRQRGGMRAARSQSGQPQGAAAPRARAAAPPWPAMSEGLPRVTTRFPAGRHRYACDLRSAQAARPRRWALLPGDGRAGHRLPRGRTGPARS